MATQHKPDPKVLGLDAMFKDFLANFSPPGYQPPVPQLEEGQDTPAPQSLMSAVVEEMVMKQQTVLYVEHQYLTMHSHDMADMILQHFERAEPVLRTTLQEHVREYHSEFLKENNGIDKEFFVGVCNLPSVEKLRDLKSESIGKLVSFSGTVTRTSEVRPELYLGAFHCRACNNKISGVEQYYKYTTPLACPTRGCQSGGR